MRKTKVVRIRDKKIGGNNPILIQSMCNTDTKDVKSTVRQIHRLEKAGCDIVRVAVPDMESAKALEAIKKEISIPLVADIHYDYKLAIESAKYADKLRFNPGNIGNRSKVKEVIKAAKKHSLPIRIGVNLGSLEKDIEAKLGLTSEAMVESALRHIKILEDNDFFNIVISLKASDIHKVIEANRILSEKVSYPLHLGISEAGSVYTGTINNSIGMGILLEQGIGNTIRVSLSGDVVEEVKAGWQILKALDLRQRGIKVIACPTCARAGIDVAKIAKEIEEKTTSVEKIMKIAVMGCSVNGPGEAKEADIGMVGGTDKALFYKNGKIIEKIDKDNIIKKLLEEIDRYIIDR